MNDNFRGWMKMLGVPTNEQPGYAAMLETCVLAFGMWTFRPRPKRVNGSAK
jgi:hypothetical protein